MAIILHQLKLKSFPLGSGHLSGNTVIVYSVLTSTLIQHSAGSQSHSNQKKEEIKGTQIGKEEVKLLLLDDMILYIQNPKNSPPKLLELTNGFSNVARCKIHIQKLGAFLYTNNEQSERKTKKNPIYKLHQKINI